MGQGKAREGVLIEVCQICILIIIVIEISIAIVHIGEYTLFYC